MPPAGLKKNTPEMKDYMASLRAKRTGTRKKKEKVLCLIYIIRVKII